MEKNDYEKSLREDVRNGKPLPRCTVCGTDCSVVLEKHHIFTRAASERTELLCKNCHAKITAEQNKVPRDPRSKDAPYVETIAFQLISVGALVRDIGKQLIKIGHEMRYNV